MIPHDHPLERDELDRLVADLAGQTELWAPHHDPTTSERSYVCLHRDDRYDAWAIFWRPENDTGWHDHDISSGAVRVVAGELDEHALRIGAPERSTTYGGGSSFTFGPSHIHRLTCSVAQAISIHAYSPPLWRLGQYAIDAEGVLHRTSVSYDELRPVAV